MKKFLPMLLLLASCPLFGQATTGAHRVAQIIARGNSGVTAQVVPYAQVSVSMTASGSPATIYSDPLLTAQIVGSIVTANGSGNYDYYFPLNTCLTESISSPSQGSIVIQNVCSTGGGSGGGSVTVVSSGNLSPLFNVTVNTSTTTPAFVFSLIAAAQNTFFAGPASGGTGAPVYRAFTLSDLPSQTANTVLGTPTTGAPYGLALPSCSGSSNALTWTAGTGFGCNTISSSGTPGGSNYAVQYNNSSAFAGASFTGLGYFSTSAAPRAAVYGDVVSLWTSCTGTNALLANGTCGSTGSGITALTGDVAASGSGSVAATLATVNSNVGTYGATSTVPIITVNAKGLITGVTTASITAAPPAAVTFYPAGVCDGGTGYASALTRYDNNQPQTGCVVPATSALGYMAFQAAASPLQYAEQTLDMPGYWTGTSAYISFYSAATTGNVTWDIQTYCVTNNSVVGTTSFSTAIGSTTAVSTTSGGLVTTALISSIAAPGSGTCPASPTVPTKLTYRIYRNASDTAAGNANLLGVTLVVGRSQ